MTPCTEQHRIAPNSGTNRHQNRHQTLGNFRLRDEKLFGKTLDGSPLVHCGGQHQE
jgi:hypothetical protein